MKHEIIKLYPWYFKHKHDIDPNSNINNSRKIGLYSKLSSFHFRPTNNILYESCHTQLKFDTLLRLLSDVTCLIQDS